jgi:hypothetical protein
VNIKIAVKWMFIPLKMVLIGIDPYPFVDHVLIKSSMFLVPSSAWRGEDEATERRPMRIICSKSPAA